MGVLSLRIFFLPLGSRYHNFNGEYVRSMDLKYTGASKPVISLNRMQMPPLFEKKFLPKIHRFSIFGVSPISPTPDVKVHFNSTREASKTPISDLRYLLPFSQN